jgi:hypothetical protein
MKRPTLPRVAATDSGFSSGIGCRVGHFRLYCGTFALWAQGLTAYFVGSERAEVQGCPRRDRPNGAGLDEDRPRQHAMRV